MGERYRSSKEKARHRWEGSKKRPRGGRPCRRGSEGRKRDSPAPCTSHAVPPAPPALALLHVPRIEHAHRAVPVNATPRQRVPIKAPSMCGRKHPLRAARLITATRLGLSSYAPITAVFCTASCSYLTCIATFSARSLRIPSLSSDSSSADGPAGAAAITSSSALTFADSTFRAASRVDALPSASFSAASASRTALSWLSTLTVHQENVINQAQAKVQGMQGGAPSKFRETQGICTVCGEVTRER